MNPGDIPVEPKGKDKDLEEGEDNEGSTAEGTSNAWRTKQGRRRSQSRDRPHGA